ncbi:hypothetical protein E1212_13780 [Jiangella ureilytica]|uniref:Uncharacterized protein n=1 Tax=Jiangella ureilytica TaxID=2530374 RepID=A0A4R4RN11_9ACTN|nr:hypothetical protein [Jiangella ureilytica]TDC50816.1 hypothetical protein E1212_13780 [Jiangella ureilytica]
MTTTERRTVTIEVRLGYPALVGAAWVTVMGLDPPLVCLGVDDPAGHRTTAWYAPGNVLMAGGHRWRVVSTSAAPRSSDDAAPGSLGEHTVAVLLRLDG